MNLKSNNSEFSIADYKIGAGNPCFIIAEVAQAHDGSLGTAHAYIDVVAKMGANAIKFQTHIAEAESTPDEPWRLKFSKQDESRYEYWKRMEFTEDQWKGLSDHAQEKNLVFLSTPFSIEAVNLLERLGMTAWKIGSGEITNYPMLEKIADLGKPVLLSSGMSKIAELDNTISLMNDRYVPFGVFQCTTAYPCPPEKTGLNMLSEFRDRYGCPVGLSDHSGTIYAGLAAASLGSNLLEVHVVFDRKCFGPDTPASVTIDELGQLVEGVRFIEKSLANPVSKEQMAGDLEDLRTIFGKGIYASRQMSPGHIIEETDLAFKKPGAGIPASEWKKVIGSKVKSEINYNEPLTMDNIEGAWS